MDMIDGYLSAIKAFLPNDQPRDILSELEANIMARIDDQEAALGRPLTDDEQAALLKQLGHPAVVASRYQGSQGSLSFGRQLIGPPLFPLYQRVLGIALSIGLIGVLVATLLIGEPLSEMLPTIVFQIVLQFGIITAIFSLAQLHLTRQPDAWDPRRPLAPDQFLTDGPAGSRFAAVVELAVLGVILVVLPAHLPLPASMASRLTITPIWGYLYLPIMLLTAASMAPPAARLLGAAPRWLEGLSAIINAIWLILLLSVTSLGPWVVLRDAAASAIDANELRWINLSIFFTLLIFAAISAWQLLVSLRKLARPAT